MKLLLPVLALLALVGVMVNCQSPSTSGQSTPTPTPTPTAISYAQWARTVSSGASSSTFNGIARDSSDNVYAVGYIDGTSSYSFGNSITAAGSHTSFNAVIVKYDSSGTALWAQTVSSGSSASYFKRAVCDSLGNIYAVGYLNGGSAVGFGNSVTVTGSSNGTNVLIVKYNSSGIAQWAKTQSSGSDQGFFSDVAVDSSDNVYAVGNIFHNTGVGFGNSVTLTGVYDGYNPILVKYNSSGATQWVKSDSSGSSHSSFNGITIDGSDNVYVVGYIAGTGTYGFGNSTTVAGIYNDDNLVIVKYDLSGLAQWARTVSSGSSYSIFFAVTNDSLGNIYAAGLLKDDGTYGFGNSVTAAGLSSTSGNSVLVKYDSSGAAQWARTIASGASGSDYYGIATDSSDNVYAVGDVFGAYGTYGFGNGVTTIGDSGQVLVKYNASGAAQWAQMASSGLGFSVLRGVMSDSSDNVYAVGSIAGNGTYNFGNGVTVTGTYTGDNSIILQCK